MGLSDGRAVEGVTAALCAPWMTTVPSAGRGHLTAATRNGSSANFVVLAGTVSFTVQVTDSAGQTATAPLSITTGVGPGGTVITGRPSRAAYPRPRGDQPGQCDHHRPGDHPAGAVVSITGSTISGPLTATRGPGSLAVCATMVSGPVQVSGATGLVLIGGTSGSPCAPDTIRPGPCPQHRRGRAGRELIGGPASVSSNTGPPMTVAANTIGGPLVMLGQQPHAGRQRPAQHRQRPSHRPVLRPGLTR